MNEFHKSQPLKTRFSERKKGSTSSPNLELSTTQTNEIGGILLMSIIREGSLFDLQELYNLEPPQRFEAIFSTIDIWKT